MKVLTIVICILSFSLCAAQDLSISNARIIDGAGNIIENGSVVVRDGIIVSVARGLNQAFSNEEVVTMLTRNTASFIGMVEEIGTLEAGKMADIILVNGDPLADISELANVEVVIQGGRVVFDKR